MSIVLSWIWAISGIAALYFFAVALFGDGAWNHFFIAFAVNVVSKALTLRTGQSEKQRKFEKQLISEGYTPEEARKEYLHQLSTGEWSIERADKIVRDYGQALLNKTPGPNGMVADESQLPHPKVVIKQAMLYLLKKGEMTDQVRESIVAGLICLPDFQPGVDEGDKGVDVGSDEHKALSPEEQIKAISASGLGQGWLEKSAAERDELVAELKREGHWRE